MYLARKAIQGKIYYFIRESYLQGNHLQSRDIFDLGTNPARYICYPGGNAYYIDEAVEDRLRDFGLNPNAGELDDIFWPFLDPEIQRVIEPLRRREKNEQYAEFKKNIQLDTKFHLFDKRRIHYLKYGQIDQKIYGASPKLFYSLFGKARDELEQYFIDKERILRANELKTYVYVIFDLQKFFTQTVAKIMPQGLNQQQLDEYFLKEICRLNDDEMFWRGMEIDFRLHEYLSRYLIMYFDNEYPHTSFLDEYLRNYIHHRQFFIPKPKSLMKLEEAANLFGVTRQELREMSSRELSKRYRRLAQKHHPDKGGDHLIFIKITKAYKTLMKRKN